MGRTNASKRLTNAGWRCRLCGLSVNVLAGWWSLTGAIGAAEKPQQAEMRDVILMLESGPVHLRLAVAVGGVSPAEARRIQVDQMLKELDTDGDGNLAREEAQRSPLFREKQRPRAQEFLKSLGAELTVSRRDVEQRFERLGGETVVYRQNASTSDSDTAVFKLLDANADGVIDDDEMFEAVDLLLAKDSDDDECVTFDEFTPPPDPAVAPVAVLLGRPAVPTATVAEILRDTHQTLLPAQMIRKYDRNRDQRLTAEELGWSPQRIAGCDANGDGALSVKELGRLRESHVDVELAVDVVRNEGRSMLRVLTSSGPRTDGDRYPDLATVRLPTAVVTFSTREVDPFETSMAIALRTFNELDGDGNGYLDRDETMSRERFGRGLFDQIDADGDEKIFGEEMKAFIRTRGEPVATTCQITVFDDGAGFFSALDVNGDRRISVREMRYADKSLVTMQQDDKPGLGEHEPARHYRIEFSRGVFNPFGVADRSADPQIAAAAARPRPVGPVWFQRWDRNNDGDLTFREFLGPRDAFEQLDADRDDLIDPKEAEAAERLRRPSSETERPAAALNESQLEEGGRPGSAEEDSE
jgi:Ca2+-binding EF-hand superfamily protein